MDQESGGEAGKAVGSQWRNYKLVADPTIRRVPQKVYRYDGLYFNLPDAGFPPIGDVRDPRQRRIWTKHRDISLPVPKFKFDEYYVGSVPLKEVTFARLNDNVKEGFLAEMCKKFGDIEDIEILYNPRNKKHLGLAKVVFTSTRGAKDTVKNLHNTSVMGNIIHAQLDIKGQQRMKYFELIVNGFYTPQTVPTGGKALSDKFPVHQADVTNDPRRRRSCDASYPAIASQPCTPGNGTPCSQDTAYSSGRQDTPSSYGQYTPQSQGTPFTPRGGTPFSQDTSYSSRQGTPVYQTFQQEAAYKQRRHDTPGSYTRRHGRQYLSYRLQEQHFPGYPQPFHPDSPACFQAASSSSEPHPFPRSQRRASVSFPPAGDAAPPYLAQPEAPAPNSYPPPPTLAPPAKESGAFPRHLDQSFQLTPEAYSRPSRGPVSPPEARPPSPPLASPPARRCSSPQPVTESLPLVQHCSLDSRIEMLLKAQRSNFSFLAADSEDEAGKEEEAGGKEEEVEVEEVGESAGSMRFPCAEEGPPPPPEANPPPLPPPLPPPPPPPAGFEDQTPSPAAAVAVSPSALPPHPEGAGAGDGWPTRGGERGRGAAGRTARGGVEEPAANGDEVASDHSSGEDMEISDDELCGPDSSERIELAPPMPPSPYPAYPHRSELGQRGGGSSRDDPSTAPFPPHIYDFVNSIELMARLGAQWGGMPMSFQMQTQMLSRLQQLARSKGLGGAEESALYLPDASFVGQPSYGLYRFLPARETRAFPEREGQSLLPSSVPPGLERPGQSWGLADNEEDPHFSTVDGVLANLIQEMKNIMKRDLNRKMVEMVAFRTFDEWWERKEQKAKPFHNAARLQPKEEEKPKPKETAMFSLVDWAKSGGVGGGAGSASGLEGYGFGMGLRASLRLPSFKVKRKEVSDLPETVEQKRPRQTLPLFEEDEGTERDKEALDTASHSSETGKREAEAGKKRGKPSKSLELNSEGEEEMSEKEEEEDEGELDASEKDSEEDEAASDTSSKAGETEEESEASTAFASSSEEEEEEEEEEEAATADTAVSTTVQETAEGKQAVGTVSGRTGDSRQEEDTARPAMDVEEGSQEEAEPTVKSKGEVEDLRAEPAISETQLSLPTPDSKLQMSAEKSSPVSVTAGERLSAPARQQKRVSFSRSEEEEKEGACPLPKRETGPTTIRNLPLDHAALVKSPSEDPGPGRRPRPRPRQPSEDESLRLKEQLGASSLLELANAAFSPPCSIPDKGVDLAGLADLALTAGETSDEEPAAPRPERLFHLEHSYAKPARLPSPSARRGSASRKASDTPRTPLEAAVGPPPPPPPPPPELLSDQLDSVLEAPEVVVSTPAPSRLPSPCAELEVGDLGFTDEGRRRKREEVEEEVEEEEKKKEAPSRPKKLEPGEVMAVQQLVGRPDKGSYQTRSEFEEMAILYEIWNSGLDPEDLHYLRLTYQQLLQEDGSVDWLNDTHWVLHTITNIPSPKRKRRWEEGMREHVTGSARSEGYYKISKTEKDAYLSVPITAREATHTRPSLSSLSQGTNRLLSERRSEQRRLLSAIGTSALVDSDLLKFNQLKFRKKKLRFGRSRIHEWGLFAMEPIAADEMVIEYVGQSIRQMVADMRERRYEDEGIGSSYLFRVDHDTIIDATKSGNLARFINHCCTPNCYAKVITLEAQKKIVIYSKQAISVNEEITYDYKFPIEENKIPCLCGKDNCRGTLN